MEEVAYSPTQGLLVVTLSGAKGPLVDVEMLRPLLSMTGHIASTLHFVGAEPEN